MNRDELILSCQEIVNNLVKKYNNHKPDEDLQSVGMIAVIECVDRSLDEGLIDPNQIQARCNVWAKNRILDEIYREKIKISDDEIALLEKEAPEDDTELMIYLEQVLTPQQKKILDLLLAGYSRQDIATELNISEQTFWFHLRNIKKLILKN